MRRATRGCWWPTVTRAAATPAMSRAARWCTSTTGTATCACCRAGHWPRGGAPCGSTSPSPTVSPGTCACWWTAPRPPPTRASPACGPWPPFEGIDVGIDRRSSPVSWDIYQRHGPFPYTNTIQSVTYTPGHPGRMAAAHTTQILKQMGQPLRVKLAGSTRGAPLATWLQPSPPEATRRRPPYRHVIPATVLAVVLPVGVWHLFGDQTDYSDDDLRLYFIWRAPGWLNELAHPIGLVASLVVLAALLWLAVEYWLEPWRKWWFFVLGPLYIMGIYAGLGGKIRHRGHHRG